MWAHRTFPFDVGFLFSQLVAFNLHEPFPLPCDAPALRFHRWWQTPEIWDPHFQGPMSIGQRSNLKVWRFEVWKPVNLFKWISEKSSLKASDIYIYLESFYFEFSKLSTLYSWLLSLISDETCGEPWSFPGCQSIQSHPGRRAERPSAVCPWALHS